MANTLTALQTYLLRNPHGLATNMIERATDLPEDMFVLTTPHAIETWYFERSEDVFEMIRYQQRLKGGE